MLKVALLYQGYRASTEEGAKYHFTDCSYSLCLSTYDLDTLRSRCKEQCFNLFNTISDNHKLSHLLPPNHVNQDNLRRNRKYDLPGVRTKRFQWSFIPAMCRLANDTL